MLKLSAAEMPKADFYCKPVQSPSVPVQGPELLDAQACLTPAPKWRAPLVSPCLDSLPTHQKPADVGRTPRAPPPPPPALIILFSGGQVHLHLQLHLHWFCQNTPNRGQAIGA